MCPTFQAMPVGGGHFGGRKATSELLKKVNSQLKGEKVTKADTDDGLGVSDQW